MNKIFGIGLNKTATKSLTDALRILGHNVVHYPHDVQTYEELRSGRFRLSCLDKVDGATDLTVATYYAELDAAFPDSKFILTVREKEDWLKSVENHWRYNAKVFDGTPGGDYKKMALFLTTATYGCHLFNAQRFSHVYDCHVRNVLSHFGDRVLVLNICQGDGWEPLCIFLGQTIPGIPFPHKNKGVYPKSF